MRYLLGIVLVLMLVASFLYAVPKGSVDGKPDLTQYSILLEKPILIWYLDHPTGIRHYHEVKSFADKTTISKNFDGKEVSTPISLSWREDYVVIQSNTDEYLVHESKIHCFNKHLVKMTYDKKNDRWIIEE